MSTSQSERMIRQYLDRVAGELHDLPATERSEILSDLRAHIDEAVGDPATASEADVRNVLERLGDPVELARESRERRSDEASDRSPGVYRRVKTGPGALEVVAIVLTALFWPIGVILAWLSPRWLHRDKVIATIVPFVSLLLMIAALVPVWTGGGIESVGADPEVVQTSPAGGPQQIEPPDTTVTRNGESIWSAIGRLLVVAGFLVSTVGGPFIAAIYLAIRLQPAEEVLVPGAYSASQAQRMGPVL